MANAVVIPPMVWQCDPRWRDDKLGFGSDTICQSGCVLCCVSSLMLLAYGTDEKKIHNYPLDIDFTLGEKKHFWGPTANLIDLLTVFRTLNAHRIKHTERVNLPRGMTYVKQQIRNQLDMFAVIKIPTGPKTFHFMLAYGVNSRNQFLAMDPLYGHTGRLIDLYGGDGRLVRADLYRVELPKTE